MAELDSFEMSSSRTSLTTPTRSALAQVDLRSPADLLRIPVLQPSSGASREAELRAHSIAAWALGRRPWTDVGLDGRQLPTPSKAEVDAALKLLRDQLAALDASLAGSPEAFIGALLSVLTAAFPRSKLSDAEAACQVEIYLQMLASYPPDLLSKAARTVLRARRFFPTIAEIEETIRDEYDARWTRRNFVARALGEAERSREIAAPSRSPVLTQYRRALLEEALEDGSWPEEVL